MLRPLRWAISSVTTLVGLWVFFFVPIGGTRTLWDHTRRILGTPEAQELGTDLGRASTQVADRVRREVIPTLATLGTDAGVGRAGDAATRGPDAAVGP